MRGSKGASLPCSASSDSAPLTTAPANTVSISNSPASASAVDTWVPLSSANPSLGPSASGASASCARASAAGNTSPWRRISPRPSTASDRCASGARSPEAPTDPCAGTQGMRPALMSRSRKRASSGLTPEKPCNRLASFSTSVRRTTASSSSGPTPQLCDRMMFRCSNVRCAGAMRVFASRPKPVLMP